MLFVCGPFLYTTVVGKSCSDWSGRTVDTFTGTDIEILDTAGEVGVIHVPYLPGGVEGMAVAGRTYTLKDADANVILHEAVHHLQVEKDGVFKYSLRYGLDWAGGMYHGCGPYDSYRAVSYEIQARRAAWSMPWPVIAAANKAGEAETFAEGLEVLGRYGELGSVLDGRSPTGDLEQVAGNTSIQAAIADVMSGSKSAGPVPKRR